MAAKKAKTGEINAPHAKPWILPSDLPVRIFVRPANKRAMPPPMMIDAANMPTMIKRACAHQENDMPSLANQLKYAKPANHPKMVNFYIVQ